MAEQLSCGNLETRLKNNAYPGRGIIIGKNDAGQWIQVYWIMGRSANSRNRIFVLEDSVLKTQAADPAKVADPSLIIYNAMRDADRRYVVTNGFQTDVICDGIAKGQSFEQALSSQLHEPDAPNYTPRISGCLDLSGPEAIVWLSLIKVSPFDTDHSEFHIFRYPLIEAGYGYAVTTYQTDGDPVPSFVGTPYIVPLLGDAQQIADAYWDVLDADNKISLAVKQIDPDSGKCNLKIINKYK